MVDAPTGRVLETRALAIAAGALSARTREELRDALGWMTYKALEVEVQRGRVIVDSILKRSNIYHRRLWAHCYPTQVAEAL